MFFVTCVRFLNILRYIIINLFLNLNQDKITAVKQKDVLTTIVFYGAVAYSAAYNKYNVKAKSNYKFNKMVKSPMITLHVG